MTVSVTLPQAIWDACEDEASARFPLETGGTFMGWWRDHSSVVVCDMIGPGPGAHHHAGSFQPDQEWQLREIARIYERSGRRTTYLGDWHTHPRAARGYVSRTDRGVLRQIISSPEARCPRPLMALLSGCPSAWLFDLWVASRRPRHLLWDGLDLDLAEVELR